MAEAPSKYFAIRILTTVKLKTETICSLQQSFGAVLLNILISNQHYIIL